MDVGERSIMIHHAMPTTDCNTSNTRVFDPFNPPTSGSQHLLAPRLIYGTVEQCILVLLLLLTNLPLDCVAPQVGTLGIFRCRTQAVSLISVLTVSTPLTPSESDEDGF